MTIKTNTKDQGFTLIELLTVIAVIAITASLAAPNMASMIRADRVAGEITALSSSIRVAKSEAIKRGSAVQLCASSDGSTCSGSNNWSTGWIIYTDPNRSQTLDIGEVVIAKEQSIKAGDSLLASNAVAGININGEGYAFSLPSTGQIVFTLNSSPVDSQAQRCLVITQTANPAIRKKGDANCA